MTTKIEELAQADTLVTFRCTTCTCVNTAWKGTEKYNRIMEQGQLNRGLAVCTNEHCNCHGGKKAKIQAKQKKVGKEAPF